MANRSHVKVIRQYPDGTRIHSINLLDEECGEPLLFHPTQRCVVRGAIPQRSWGIGITGAQNVEHHCQYAEHLRRIGFVHHLIEPTDACLTNQKHEFVQVSDEITLLNHVDSLRGCCLAVALSSLFSGVLGVGSRPLCSIATPQIRTKCPRRLPWRKPKIPLASIDGMLNFGLGLAAKALSTRALRC